MTIVIEMILVSTLTQSIRAVVLEKAFVLEKTIFFLVQSEQVAQNYIHIIPQGHRKRGAGSTL